VRKKMKFKDQKAKKSSHKEMTFYKHKT